MSHDSAKDDSQLNVSDVEDVLQMPLLMKLGMWFASVFAIGAIVLLSLAASGLVRPLWIGNQVVETKVWLRIAGPLFLLTSVLMAGIAYGFRTRKAWSRHLVMIMWAAIGLYGLILGAAGDVPRELAWRALIESVVFGSVAAWYFYVKTNVVEYFRALNARKESSF
ncbi:MAG: hypothetical protein H0V88_04565 [Pyrinomonadaceae bacterium]|nr:hypothetical protein [Pyrinomonadaceae bacterium]